MEQQETQQKECELVAALDSLRTELQEGKRKNDELVNVMTDENSEIEQLKRVDQNVIICSQRLKNLKIEKSQNEL
jgi:hypothetical protein